VFGINLKGQNKIVERHKFFAKRRDLTASLVAGSVEKFFLSLTILNGIVRSIYF